MTFKIIFLVKILVRFAFSLFCCIGGFCLGYDNIGFVDYQELEDGIHFECGNQCMVLLGQRNDADVLVIDGRIEGSGEFQILTPSQDIYRDTVSPLRSVSIRFSNVEKSIEQVPSDSELLVMFNGSIKGNLKIYKKLFSSSKKFLVVRNEFWSGQIYINSMNLGHGALIDGIGILRYGYAIFALFALGIIFFVRGKRKQKFRMILYIGVGLFLFVGIRNTVSYTYILHQGLSGFTKDKEFFDLGEFIPFMEKVREELGLTYEENRDCTIYMKSYGNRNIDDHGWFYFKPCKKVLTGDLADYKIYYKTAFPIEDLDKKILVNFKGSYLLDNKSK